MEYLEQVIEAGPKFGEDKKKKKYNFLLIK
jgi:hypothetical protein